MPAQHHGQRRSSLKQDDVREHARQSHAAGDCHSVKGHHEADRITKLQLAPMTFKPMRGFTARTRLVDLSPRALKATG